MIAGRRVAWPLFLFLFTQTALAESALNEVTMQVLDISEELEMADHSLLQIPLPGNRLADKVDERAIRDSAAVGGLVQPSVRAKTKGAGGNATKQ